MTPKLFFWVFPLVWLLSFFCLILDVESKGLGLEICARHVKDAVALFVPMVNYVQVPHHCIDLNELFANLFASNAIKTNLPTTEYDVVFDIGKMEDIINGVGWNITFGGNFLKQFRDKSMHGKQAIDFFEMEEDYFEGAVVAIVGEYNKGKTYFFNRFAGLELLSGSDVSTRGLSFIKYPLETHNLILVDTVGTGVPVPNFTMDDYLQQRMVEEIVRHAAFQMADYHILVVNDMTAHDQEILARLVENIGEDTSKTKTGDSKAFFVVHNLRSMHSTTFPSYYRSRIGSSFPAIQCASLDDHIRKDESHQKMKQACGADFLLPLCDNLAAGDFYLSIPMQGKLAKVHMYNFFFLSESSGPDTMQKCAKLFNDAQLRQIKISIKNRLVVSTFREHHSPINKVMHTVTSHMIKYTEPESESEETASAQEVEMEIPDAGEPLSDMRVNNKELKLSFGDQLSNFTIQMSLSSKKRLILFAPTYLELTPPIPDAKPSVSKSMALKNTKIVVGPRNSSRQENVISAYVVEYEVPGIWELDKISIWKQVGYKENQWRVEYAKPQSWLQGKFDSPNGNRKSGKVTDVISLPNTDLRHRVTCLKAGILTIYFAIDDQNVVICDDLQPRQPAVPAKATWWPFF